MAITRLTSLHASIHPMGFTQNAMWQLNSSAARELKPQGRLTGVIELVRVASPIGLGQMFQATHQGRFELGSGRTSIAISLIWLLPSRQRWKTAWAVTAEQCAADSRRHAGRWMRCRQQPELQGMQRLLLNMPAMPM